MCNSALSGREIAFTREWDLTGCGPDQPASEACVNAKAPDSYRVLLYSWSQVSLFIREINK